MNEKSKQSEADADAENGYGSTPYIDANTNAQTQAAYQALKTGEHPERLSTLIYSQEAFNLDTYRENPAEYLNIPEPGRAFQPAQPGPGVPKIQPISRPYSEVEQGNEIELSVKGVPHSPHYLHKYRPRHI